MLRAGPVRPKAAALPVTAGVGAQAGGRPEAKMPSKKQGKGKLRTARKAGSMRGGKEKDIGASLCAIQAFVQAAKLVPGEAEAWSQVKDGMRGIGWAPWRYRLIFCQDLLKEMRAVRGSQWAWRRRGASSLMPLPCGRP